MRSPLWTTEPDKSLVNLAIEAHTQLRQSRARKELDYFKNLNLDKAGGLNSNSEIANPRAGTDFQWLSPQSVFSQEALRLHQSLTLKNWDKVFLELLSRLLNDGEMDPVFKYQLLPAILQPALKGSWPLQQGFLKHLDLVAAGTVNTQENYFDPGSEESAAVRQAATGVLGQMPNTATSIEAVRSAMQSMESVDLGPHYRWIGWLHLGHRSNWICDMPASKKPREDESGELFVVHAASTSEPPQFKSVGKVAARAGPTRRSLRRRASRRPARFLRGDSGSLKVAIARSRPDLVQDHDFFRSSARSEWRCNRRNRHPVGGSSGDPGTGFKSRA